MCVYGETLFSIQRRFVTLLVNSYQYTPVEAEKLATYDAIKVETEWEYDGESVIGVLRIPVSTKEYADMVVKHEAKLKAYNKWYAANKDEIEVELAVREVQKREQETAKAQKEVDRLGKLLAKNHEKLKTLGVESF